MKKSIIKINENTLRQIVAESVKKVLREEMLNEHQIVSSTDDIINRYYNSVKEAYSLLVKANNLLNGSINVHDIEWMTANEKQNDINYCLPEGIDLVSRARANIGGVLSAMEEYHNKPEYEPEDWSERNEHGDFDEL